MQALLFAVGLNATTAIPAAAALNWVIKDGLGQFGGMFFASLVNKKFDADPKKWRLVAAVSLDAATLVEVLTPLFPHLFLPMASIANVGKNVSWLAASSTKAGIHKTFIRHENMGDVTAKAGSQAICASLLGTGAGIALSSVVGTGTGSIIAMCSTLSAVHLYCTHRSLSHVVVPTLNHQRAETATRRFLKNE